MRIPVFFPEDGDDDAGHHPVSPLVASWTFTAPDEFRGLCSACRRGICIQRFVSDLEGDRWILHGTWEA